MSGRNELINNWLEKTLTQTNYDIKKLAGDASFRCYYRVTTHERTYILMDAPPTQECCKSFIKIDTLLTTHGIHAPQVFHQNIKDGLLLLEDFGDEVLLNRLSPSNADAYYQKAIDIICQMQSINPEPNIPTFDKAFIQQELMLFKTWFLDKLLHYKILAQEETLLDGFFESLAQNILTQPYTFIHRDYHARNLMRLKDDSLGILDFQDAMLGPNSYDLVSLLKDAYITWPREKQEQWLSYYYDRATTLNLFADCTLPQFIKNVEITGLQRHIKIIGIFARLYKRDGKAQYLNDIPRVLHYILDALTRTNNNHEVYQLFIDKVIPNFEQFQWTNDAE